MKKRILCTILLATLTLLMLASCGGGTKIEDLYNTEWTMPTATLTQKADVGVTGTQTDYNRGISVLVGTNESLAKVTHVYSHYTNKVLKSCTDETGITYTVELLATDLGTLFVIKRTELKIDLSIVTTATLYDALGNELQKYEDGDELTYETMQYSYDGHIVLIGDKIYRENRDGSATMIKEFDLGSIPEVGEIDAYVNGNYYILDSDTVAVYNSEFVPIFYYELPSYASGSSEIFVLPEGNVLVQVLAVLPEDATDYDYFNGSTKFEVVDLLFDVTDGSSKEIDLGALVRNVMVLTEDNTPEALKDAFGKDFKAYAAVAYIGENRRVDSSATAIDYVFIDADGKLSDTLKITDALQSFPTPVASGLYMAYTVYGEIVIFNVEGEKVVSFDGSADYTNNYIYTKKAIYRIDGTKVYDLVENNAEVYGEVGENLILSKVDEGTTTYHLFKDDKTTPITADGGEGAGITVLCMNDYYHVSGTGKQTYYNAKGELLMTSDNALEQQASVRDGYVMRDVITGTFYKFIFDIILVY